ncbi:hypothetical protein [Saccharopolyspora sp. NPDC002376]
MNFLHLYVWVGLIVAFWGGLTNNWLSFGFAALGAILSTRDIYRAKEHSEFSFQRCEVHAA